jgi:hypothetical protein
MIKLKEMNNINNHITRFKIVCSLKRRVLGRRRRIIIRRRRCIMMKESTKVVDGHLFPRRHPTRRLAANTTAQENTNAIVVGIVRARGDSDQLHVRRCDDNNAYIGNPNGGLRCDILGSRSAIISDKAASTQSVSATCEQNKGIVGKGVRRRGHRRKDVVKMGQVDGVRKIEKVIKNNNSQSRRLQRYT